MDKEFVPYEEALALKELGFDEPCFGGYDMETLKLWIGYLNDGEQFNREYYYPAPTFSQAFRWFREKNYNVTYRKMDYGNDSVFTGYYYTIYKGIKIIDLHGADKRSKIYEEIELACLRKLIEIVKQNL